MTPERNLLVDLENQDPGIIDEIHSYADALDEYSDLQQEIWEELIPKLACDIEQLPDEEVEKQVLDVDLGPIYGDSVDMFRTEKKGKVLPGLANAIIGIPDLDDIEEEGVREIWEVRKDHYLQYREKEEFADYFKELDRQLAKLEEQNEELIEIIVDIREQYKREFGLTEAEISEVEAGTTIENSVIAEVI